MTKTIQNNYEKLSICGFRILKAILAWVILLVVGQTLFGAVARGFLESREGVQLNIIITSSCFVLLDPFLLVYEKTIVRLS